MNLLPDTTFRVQQEYDGTAEIEVRGRLYADFDRVEARWGDADWVVLDPRPIGGLFSGALRLPAGWAELHVRGVQAGHVMDEVTVGPVGVGEVFITAGQAGGFALSKTQRLTRAVGKAKAMDMCLTGRMMDAKEAERAGLVSRVVPLDNLMEAAGEAAAKIAAQSQPIAMITKETVNAGYEMSLAQGIRFERRMFMSMFTTEDQKEGMAAFVEKRKPHFKNR